MRGKRKIIAYLLSMALMLTSLPTQLFAQVTNDLPIPMTALVDTQTTTPGAIQINPNKYIGDGYEVEFKVTNQWPGAFNGEFVLTNTSDKPLENWTLKFDFEHEITNMWNAQIVTHEANSYIIKNQEYNQDVAPGSSVNIGFQANWNDEIKVPKSYNLLVSKQEVGDTDYTVDFKVTGDWGQAFNGEISITNNTEETIEDWTLEFDFDRNIERFWTAEIIKYEGGHYVIKNAGYNANIAPGETVILGFSGNPGNINTKPEKYILRQIENTKDNRIEVDYNGNGDYLYTKPISEQDISEGMVPVEIDGVTYETKAHYVRNQLCFFTVDEVTFEQVRNMIKGYDGIIIGYVSAVDYYQIEFKESTLEELLELANKINEEQMIYDETAYLNLVSMHEQQSTVSTIPPNDPWEGATVEWNEDNPSGGNWGIECIKALSAWQYSSQMQPVKIGILDREFFKHEDIPFTSYSEDEMFLDQKMLKQLNYQMHGNEIAGIIGARHNDVGISGVAPNVSDIYGVANALTLGDSNLVTTITDLVKNKDVKIINYSIGDGEEPIYANSAKKYTGPLLKKLASKYEFLIVTSAGNSGEKTRSCRLNNEFTAIEDSEVRERIIIVGAIDNGAGGNYKISRCSQLGEGVILAPGANIYTTQGGSYYTTVPHYGEEDENLGGATSFAAPHVAGTAAMLWGIAPEKTAAEIKELIMDTADRKLGGQDGNTYGIVNAYNAILQVVPAETGTVSGSVKSAVGLMEIKDANIYVDGILTTHTDANGEFTSTLTTGKTHIIQITAEGFMEVNYCDVQVEKGKNVNLATIMQVPMAYQSIKGRVTGKIVNAMTGTGMQGLTINIRKDINNKTGKEITKTIKTSNGGLFETGELANGVYTGEILSDQTIPTYFNFVCIGESNDIGIIAVTPLLSDNEMRIVLTWGKNPRDLDSHLIGPTQHIYYGAKNGIGVNLDYDYTQSYGPETITMVFDKLPVETYKYCVNWYAGSGTWDKSEAKIQVYIGSNLVKEFYVPNSMRTSGGNWEVFTVDTKTKTILAL